jgi:phosphonate transport system substrate-binding protein
MPAYFMRFAGVDPAVIDRAAYTGGHDATALEVSERRVDAGALDEMVWDRLIRKGKIDPGRVRVIWTTPAFCDDIWAVRKDLDLGLTRDIVDAFFALDPAIPEHRPVLEVLSTQGRHVAVDARAYAHLRIAARQQGLLH